MNYTQGPWYANLVKHEGHKLEYCIASDTGPVCGVGTRIPNCHDQVKANAHLIAAAPEMYRTLRLLIERFEAMGRQYSYPMSLDLPRALAEKALAKAEGKEAK